MVLVQGERLCVVEVMAKLPAPKKKIGKGLPGNVKLADMCANPWCDRPARENHHAVRRSYLDGPFDCVELYGRPWPNLIPVCRECHLKLELNHAMLWALEHDGRYVWRENAVSEFLNPHPVLEDGEPSGCVDVPLRAASRAGSPSSSTGVTEGERPSPSEKDNSDADKARSGPTEGSPSVTPDATCPHLALAPGESCPGCGWRAKHPRKTSSPASRVFSMRVPADEMDVFGETVDAAAEWLGVKEQPHHRFKTVALAAALVLQDEGLRDFGRR